MHLSGRVGVVSRDGIKVTCGRRGVREVRTEVADDSHRAVRTAKDACFNTRQGRFNQQQEQENTPESTADVATDEEEETRGTERQETPTNSEANLRSSALTANEVVVAIREIQQVVQALSTETQSSFAHVETATSRSNARVNIIETVQVPLSTPERVETVSMGGNSEQVDRTISVLRFWGQPRVGTPC